jgi:hypothetical protein
MERCVCGGEFEPSTIRPHVYLGASSGCWKAYTDFVAWEYSRYGSNEIVKDLHRLAVDTYASQHGANQDRRNIQSAQIHLVSLYLHLRRGLSLDHAHAAKKYLAETKPSMAWLEPPDFAGALSIADVPIDPCTEEYREFVLAWADTVLAAWMEKHGGTIAALADLAERRGV